MFLKVPRNQVHRACVHNVEGRPPGADARTALPNCRVLIVEDEYFLAQDLAVALQSRGAKIAALVGELGEALEQLARGGFDVAVVDINLKGEFAYRIADELRRLVLMT